MSETTHSTTGAPSTPAKSGASATMTTAAPREQFLDAVRTLAIVRVVLWHALGATVLTYFFAAVPAMFFVTGSLLAKSLRKGARVVILDRARRILVPLWFFTLAAFTTMFVAHRIDGTAKTAVPWRDLIFWLLPLDDPHGSKWEGGYMSSPLWYLRALLWLILLSGVMLTLVRRSRIAAFGTTLTGLAVLEYLGRSGRWYSPWSWRLGDLCLYATFLMAGFCHRDGRLDHMTRKAWALAAGTFGVAGAIWCITQMHADHVVNDSHPAHLLVGGFWLCVLFWARPYVERLAGTRTVSRFIGFVNQRSITIYLWHSTAVIVSFELLRRAGIRWFPGGWVIMLLASTAAITLVFVLATGWVEDLANRRHTRIWPGTQRVSTPSAFWRILPGPALAITTVGALLLFAAADETAFSGHRAEAAALPPSTSIDSGSDTTSSTLPTTTTTANVGLRVPSQQPKAPVFATVSTSTPAQAGPAELTTAPATVPATEPASTTTAPATTTPATSVAVSPATAVSALVAPNVVSPATAAKMQTTFENWLKTNGVSGGEVAVARDGLSWTTAVGFDTSINQANTVDTRVDIWSITKTFTAALVFQAADQKLINLDAPLPKLNAVPDFPYAGKITPRELLAHRTGLINYRGTPAYLANPNSIDSAVKAVADVGTQPLHFAPGTQTEYSSTNYLVLGLLLEQVTGKTYDTLVTALEQQANLGDIPHTPPYGGAPNFSTGGLKPTTMQLAQWGLALLRDNTPGISAKDLTDMMALDPDTSVGQGVWGYCPCTTDAQGKHHWTAFGHGGAVSQFEYAPADKTSIAVNIDASIYVPDNRQDQLNQLFIDLRKIADAG